MSDANGRTGRRPGPGTTREALLTAARAEFTDKGYKGATVRAIATAAGVDPGLIRHFFGGKDGLFIAAMELPGDVVERVLATFDQPVDTWGTALARTYFSLWEEPEVAAPLQAVMVSALTDERAREQLRGFLTAHVLTHRLDGPGSDRTQYRLALVMSHLLGTSVARYIFGIGPLAERTTDDLVADVGPILQRYLTGELPSA